MKRNHTRSLPLLSLTLVAGLVATAFAALHFQRPPVLIYDEGLALYGAIEVLHGSVPYRDFWAVYPPGQFYTLAALFWLFGPTVLTERLWEVVVRGLLTASYTGLALRFLPLPWAVALGVASIWMVTNLSSFASAVMPSLILAFAGAGWLLDYGRTRQNGRLILAGITIGLAALFRHDLGGYTFAASSVALIAMRSEELRPAGWRPVMLFAAAAASPVLAVTVLLLIPVGAAELVDSLIVFPATALGDVRALPYPSLVTGWWTEGTVRWVRFWFPVLVAAAAMLLALGRTRSRWASEPTRTGLVLTAALSATYFLQGLNRADAGHLFPARVTALLTAAALLAPLVPSVVLSRRRQLWLGAAATLLALAVSLGPVLRWAETAGGFWPFSCASPIAGAGCIPVEADQAAAIRFVKERTTEQERVFVGNRRHDRIFINDVSFYFLADRRSATKYHHLHPGVADTRDVQASIVSSLDEQAVRYVILYSGAEEQNEPNLSSQSSGVHLLDEAIARQFAPVARFGRYEVLRRLPDGAAP